MWPFLSTIKTFSFKHGILSVLKFWNYLDSWTIKKCTVEFYFIFDQHRAASSLWLPQLPRCPCTIGVRLCEWNCTIKRFICAGGVPEVMSSYTLHQTASIKKKWCAMPFWREQKAQYAILDPLLRAVCCLPGAWVKCGKTEIPTLVQPSDYHPLLIFRWSAMKQ